MTGFQECRVLDITFDNIVGCCACRNLDGLPRLNVGLFLGCRYNEKPIKTKFLNTRYCTDVTVIDKIASRVVWILTNSKKVFSILYSRGIAKNASNHYKDAQQLYFSSPLPFNVSTFLITNRNCSKASNVVKLSIPRMNGIKNSFDVIIINIHGSYRNDDLINHVTV